MHFNMPSLPALAVIAIVQAAFAQDMVIGDFESGKLDAGWTVTGTTFVVSKASDLFAKLAAWQQNGRFVGYNGSWLIHTKGNEDEWNRPKAGEGTITSPEFTIERDYVVFRCGGMVSPICSYTLTVDGKVLESLDGNNNFDLIDRGWDVRAYKGKKARFKASTGGTQRILLRFDYVRQSNTRPDPENLYKSFFKGDNPWVRPGVFRHVIKGPVSLGRTNILKAGTTWNMYGMEFANTEGHYQGTNKVLMRATAPSLMGQWTTPQKVFEVNGTTEKYICGASVVFDNGTYYLFYSTGTKTGVNSLMEPPFLVNLATSPDGANWRRHEGNPLFTVGATPGMLPVVRNGSEWIIYVGQGTKCAGEDCRSTPYYAISTDLKKWSSLKSALSGTDAFLTENMCSVTKVGKYWYMIGRLMDARTGRMRHAHSNVIRSENPYSFSLPSSGTLLNVFGSGQIVRDDDGRYYITHGGPVPTIEGPKGVWMADVRIEGVSVATVPQQSIVHATADAPLISLSNGRIMVNGAIAGDQVSLFDGRGRMLMSTPAVATGSVSGLSVPANGTYVVSLSRGGRTLSTRPVILTSGGR